MDPNDWSVKNKLIVGLDVGTKKETKALLKELSPHVLYFKVGLRLTTAIGAPQAVKLVLSHKRGVFLDNKFNDIPETMGWATAEAVKLGAGMISVHASAGRRSVEAAVRNRRGSLILGATVLSSMDEKECREIFAQGPQESVYEFARLLRKMGANGIICSPREVEMLRRLAEFKESFLISVGIRPAWYENNDQKRTMTPGDAIMAGASKLVIARPVIKPNKGNPAEAVRLIYEEIAVAMEKRRRNAEGNF